MAEEGTASGVSAEDEFAEGTASGVSADDEFAEDATPGVFADDEFTEDATPGVSEDGARADGAEEKSGVCELISPEVVGAAADGAEEKSGVCEVISPAAIGAQPDSRPVTNTAVIAAVNAAQFLFLLKIIVRISLNTYISGNLKIS